MVATLTRLDTDRIVCKTIFEERLFGAMMAGIATLCLIGGGYALAHGPIDSSKLLFFVPYILAAAAFLWAGMIPLGVLKSEWLVVDLTRKRYSGRRGLLFWAETLRGPLDDLDHIRLVKAPADHREGRPGWAFEFAWRKDSHLPFLVTHWKRPRSFHLEHCWGELDSRSLLSNLKAMSRYTGLPVGVPKAYLDGLGLFDSEIDAL
jgi:hypothetical protein